MNDPRIGTTTLGGFRLLGVLGSGAFATAYLAEQQGTRRQAVVKIAHPHLMQGREASVIRSRFSEEVHALTKISHPNMVTVYTSGDTEESLPAIALELVPGDSLEDFLLRRAPLQLNDFSYIVQLCSVLAVLHRNGVVHRDVSPGNMILTRDHREERKLVLLDFGIAKLADSTAQSLGPVGTPRYAAPEQIRGAAVPASDMYAVGAILWWGLTAREYLDEAKSLPELVSMQMHTQVRDPRTIAPNAPPPLADLTEALLSKNPSERPTASEVVERWPELISSSRKWLKSRVGRRHAASSTRLGHSTGTPQRILVVDPDPVKRHLVSGFASRIGCEVVQTDNPRQATRGELGTFDIVLLATELGKVNALAVCKHLREHFPGQRVVLMTQRDERVVDVDEAGADILITVPGELVRFYEYLKLQQRADPARRPGGSTLPALSTTVVAAWRALPFSERKMTADRFLGEMPELIAGLEDGPESCAKIIAFSSSIGADHLGRLAKSYQMLASEGELEDARAFVPEIEREYQKVFRELRPLIEKE